MGKHCVAVVRYECPTPRGAVFRCFRCGVDSCCEQEQKPGCWFCPLPAMPGSVEAEQIAAGAGMNDD